MKSRKRLIMNVTLLFLTLLIPNLDYAQNRGEHTSSFPGFIEQVSPDLRFVVVNETKIILSANTQIMTEKGGILRPSDLKAGNAVILEVLKNPSGFLAKKIVVKVGKK